MYPSTTAMTICITNDNEVYYLKMSINQHLHKEGSSLLVIIRATTVNPSLQILYIQSYSSVQYCTVHTLKKKSKLTLKILIKAFLHFSVN